MAIDFNPMKKNELYSAKDAGEIAGVALKRIYDLVDAGIIKPASVVKKGDEIRSFTYYDATNVLEIYLVNRLTAFGLPKRVIKHLFNAIGGNRDTLNPFKIVDHKGLAYLCFYQDGDGETAFVFLENKRVLDSTLKEKSAFLMVNLKAFVGELFKRVPSRQ